MFLFNNNNQRMGLSIWEYGTWGAGGKKVQGESDVIPFNLKYIL